MNECPSAWTPENTLGFIFGLLCLLYFTGILEGIVEILSERKR